MFIMGKILLFSLILVLFICSCASNEVGSVFIKKTGLGTGTMDVFGSGGSGNIPKNYCGPESLGLEYDPNTQKCCYDHFADPKYAVGKACCGKHGVQKPYDPDNEKCCTWDGIGYPGKECCGDPPKQKGYDPNSEKCCTRGVDIIVGKECCGDEGKQVAYDPANEKCCVYDGDGRTGKECCGKENKQFAYDPSEKKCCKGKRNDLLGKDCCGKEGNQKPYNPKYQKCCMNGDEPDVGVDCCGVDGKQIAYTPEFDKCCYDDGGSSVADKDTEFTCCGHVFVDTRTDDKNCGACDHVCDACQHCVEGVCEDDVPADVGKCILNCGCADEYGPYPGEPEDFYSPITNMDYCQDKKNILSCFVESVGDFICGDGWCWEDVGDDHWDCDDFAIATKYLCDAYGIFSCTFIFGHEGGSHAQNIIEFPSEHEGMRKFCIVEPQGNKIVGCWHQDELSSDIEVPEHILDYDCDDYYPGEICTIYEINCGFCIEYDERFSLTVESMCETFEDTTGLCSQSFLPLEEDPETLKTHSTDGDEVTMDYPVEEDYDVKIGKGDKKYLMAKNVKGKFNYDMGFVEDIVEEYEYSIKGDSGALDGSFSIE